MAWNYIEKSKKVNSKDKYCIQCGKKGLFLKLNSDGLCSECKQKEQENEIQNLKNKVIELSTEEYKNLDSINKKIEKSSEALSNIENNIKNKQIELTDLITTINERKKDLIILEDEILMQEFGLYTPIYEFASSCEYKNKLDEIRKKQKELIKSNKACTFNPNWTVNGSKSQGNKMTKDNIKQILRTFNIESENCIDNVKYNNVESMKNRITKSFETLNKLNKISEISITYNYLSLKQEELNLAIEFQLKKQEEKEEQKRIKEELREQAKLEKELAEARKNIIKEQTHFNKALENIKNKILIASDNELEELKIKQEELEQKLNQLSNELKDVDYREKCPKAGYVYIISNIGSFGENVYKIGMTRRLDPMERIHELGDASVPFNFDVHAMIFCEDAPALENSLHKAFEDKKVNMVNYRREFFNVSLDEIETVVKENYDKTVTFNKIPEAEQYRISKQMKQ